MNLVERSADTKIPVSNSNQRNENARKCDISSEMVELYISQQLNGKFVAYRPNTGTFRERKVRDWIYVTEDRNPFLVEIREAVCRVTKVSKQDFISPRRQHSFCAARKIYFYLARKLTTASYPMIGNQCGFRDHTTVLYGIRWVNSHYADFEGKIMEVCKLLQKPVPELEGRA